MLDEGYPSPFLKRPSKGWRLEHSQGSIAVMTPGMGQLKTGIILWLALPLVCLPSVFLMSPNVTRAPWPSSSIFAYSKQSKTRGDKGLGTRLPLCVELAHVVHKAFREEKQTDRHNTPALAL